MDIWFGGQSSSSGEFDRAAKLKGALFDFFADHSKTPPVMNYISMVSDCWSFYLSWNENISFDDRKNIEANACVHFL